MGSLISTERLKFSSRLTFLPAWALPIARAAKILTADCAQVETTSECTDYSAQLSESENIGRSASIQPPSEWCIFEFQPFEVGSGD